MSACAGRGARAHPTHLCELHRLGALWHQVGVVPEGDEVGPVGKGDHPAHQRASRLAGHWAGCRRWPCEARPRSALLTQFSSSKQELWHSKAQPAPNREVGAELR